MIEKTTKENNPSILNLLQNIRPVTPQKCSNSVLPYCM